MRQYKALWAIIIFTIFSAVAAKAYVTLTQRAAGDTLTSTIYNGNLTALDNGLDSIIVSFNDSINNRLPTIVPLFWTQAFGDSTAANDSMRVEITTYTPLGNTQALRVVNSQGVIETVTLFLDFFTYSNLANLDSIRVPIWTEATNGTDYVAFHVFDDSSNVNRFKSKWTAQGAGSTSTAARTAKTISVTGINLKGGQVRLEAVIKVTSDSAFVGQPLAYLTNQ